MTSKPTKKMKPVKAIAIVGPDNQIATVADAFAATTRHLAVYGVDVIFSAKIKSSFNLREVPVLITPLPPSRKAKAKKK